MKRPLAITIVGWVFVASGCITLVAHLWPLFRATTADPREPADVALVVLSAALSICGGTFLLRGRGWARWLLLAWMGFHVVLSFWHSSFQLGVHAVFFAALWYLLTRPSVSAFFRAA
jgi:hypothetical protein